MIDVFVISIQWNSNFFFHFLVQFVPLTLALRCRHLELRCQQQQEQLTAQLEAKEKAASADRLEQQQFKRNLERKAREQTELKEKTVMDTNQKLSSLQQHYKLLKSQNDDLTEECTKTKAKQLADIKLLQDKIKTLQSQHQKDVDSAKVIWKIT